MRLAALIIVIGIGLLILASFTSGWFGAADGARDANQNRFERMQNAVEDAGAIRDRSREDARKTDELLD